MIRDLTDTTTTGISKTLVRLRNEVGAMALGRVLTLVVVVEDTDAGTAIEVANQASRQHPCRIIVVIPGDRRGRNRLDAQIRLGGDAGASEIVVLRLYGALANHGPSVVVPLLLPDSPIVAWWPGEAPADVGTGPHRSDGPAPHHRRGAAPQPARHAQEARGELRPRRHRPRRGPASPGGAVCSPRPSTSRPTSRSPAPSSAARPTRPRPTCWPHGSSAASRCRCTASRRHAGSGISSVRLDRKSGPIDLVRPGDAVATLSQAGQPDRRISLPRREVPECLADELRRLDPDDAYEDALLHGLQALAAGAPHRRRGGEGRQGTRPGGVAPPRGSPRP